MPEKNVKVKYIGSYRGISPIIRREVFPGDVIEVTEEIAKKLLSTRQFKKVKKRAKNEVPGGEK